MAWRSIVSR